MNFLYFLHSSVTLCLLCLHFSSSPFSYHLSVSSKSCFQFIVHGFSTLLRAISKSRLSEFWHGIPFTDCSTGYQMWHTTLWMACALQFLINLLQSTSLLATEGTRRDSPPSKRHCPHFQLLSSEKTGLFVCIRSLPESWPNNSCSKQFAACRSRSRGTRPSGRRASGTPSWTSRTGRTRTTRGTATRTAARWPPTPCGSPTATGSRRTTPLPPPSEDDAPPSSWLLTINKQSIPSVGRRSKKEKKHVIVYIRGFHVHRTGCLSRRCEYTVVLWTCGCGLTSCVY